MASENFNFYTDVALDVTLNKKVYHCQLGIFCLINWNKAWVPTFNLVKYQLNELKSGDTIIKSDKKILDAIKFFWQNNQSDLQKSVLKEYMMFAYICEGQKNRSKTNIDDIIEKL